MKRVGLRCLEVALLVPAFGLLVPAVPSGAGQRYSLLPGLFFAAACFALSLALACRRGGESWFVAAIKMILFCVLGYAIDERVWMFHQ